MSLADYGTASVTTGGNGCVLLAMEGYAETGQQAAIRGLDPNAIQLEGLAAATGDILMDRTVGSAFKGGGFLKDVGSGWATNAGGGMFNRAVDRFAADELSYWDQDLMQLRGAGYSKEEAERELYYQEVETTIIEGFEGAVMAGAANLGGRIARTISGEARYGKLNVNQWDTNTSTIDIFKKYNLEKVEDVWGLKGYKRGIAIEELLACSEYSDWWNCGAEMGGYFPVVDFQKGLDVVSLKTIDPTLPSYQNGKGTNAIISYIDALDRKITIEGENANRILDIRIPEGTDGYLDVNYVRSYAKTKGIVVKIKEF